MLAMRSVAAISSASIKHFARYPAPHRSFSSETGTVKFYLRRKSYGFITRDTNGEDIFVHRTAIVGAAENDPTNPELRNGERLKFTINTAEDGKKLAAQVTYEDGSTIPMFRDDYQGKRIRSIKSRLGFQVYDILTEGGDEETIAKKIAEAYSTARDEIKFAENISS